jgi:E3 ubiquitin-protein ligase SHPRH
MSHYDSSNSLTYPGKSYFRQLQEISDSVAEVEWVGDVSNAIKECRAQQVELETKVNTNRARQRYLDHLAKNKEDGAMDEDEDTCILCKCEFVRGFITQWYAFILFHAAA